MTNGQPDSILELSDEEQDAFRADAYREAHPDCEECGETLCLTGSGCGCGELEGMRIPGTLTIAVHLGTCHVTHEAQERHEAARGPDIVERLVSDVAEGVRVLVTRDKIPLTEAQVLERARGIASSILGNYDLRLLPVAGLRMTVDFDTTPGKPIGHSWSCNCYPCEVDRRAVRR